MKTILILFLLHIFSDFTLQGLFGNLKSKWWWMDECNNYKGIASGKVMYAKYKYDHIPGLLLHSLYWSMITFLPLWWPDTTSDWARLLIVGLNMAVHYGVDDWKVNRFRLNLCQDQAIHAVQIILTYGIWRAFS